MLSIQLFVVPIELLKLIDLFNFTLSIINSKKEFIPQSVFAKDFHFR